MRTGRMAGVVEAEDGQTDRLERIEAALWSELARAAVQPAHEWQHLTLATQDDEHGPDARTVVLREVQVDRHELMFYSDTRASKIDQLRRQPVAMVVCWSRALSWQLRLRCRLQVATDGLHVTARWARLRHSPSAQDYLAPRAPGTVLLEGSQGHATPGRECLGERRTRQHFAVLTAQVESVDWLELRPEGHRRARFDAGGARWISP
ncbi:pyridoxamine 5'-phosphate oxidase family protein [Sphaerotilus hippei]|nr:pyridoxamine 5'-phosphate oxidase family protein [Sphaerotilus hippei]